MKTFAVWMLLLLCRIAVAAPDFADRSQEQFATKHNGNSVYRLYAAHLSEKEAPTAVAALGGAATPRRVMPPN